jgi:superfamily II DNA or RNA helicase
MATSDTDAAVPLLPSARDYQQEMLEQSMRRNIVVAMDTGSGKTLIAVLRIKKFLGTSSRTCPMSRIMLSMLLQKKVQARSELPQEYLKECVYSVKTGRVVSCSHSHVV